MFSARHWAKTGIDVVFNFDEDTNVAKEAISILSTRGTFVQIGGDLPHQLQRGHHYMSVDYPSLTEDNGIITQALEIISPTVRVALVQSMEIFDLSKYSTAQSKARSRSNFNTTILLDLEKVDPELSILRGGIMRGTSAFNPRSSYVIIGGIGGLGASMARCLVENGAKHVILTSRSGEKVNYSHSI